MRMLFARGKNGVKNMQAHIGGRSHTQTKKKHFKSAIMCYWISRSVICSMLCESYDEEMKKRENMKIIRAREKSAALLSQEIDCVQALG